MNAHEKAVHSFDIRHNPHLQELNAHIINIMSLLQRPVEPSLKISNTEKDASALNTLKKWIKGGHYTGGPFILSFYGGGDNENALTLIEKILEDREFLELTKQRGIEMAKIKFIVTARFAIESISMRARTIKKGKYPRAVLALSEDKILDIKTRDALIQILDDHISG